jgi:hypothetical protein
VSHQLFSATLHQTRCVVPRHHLLHAWAAFFARAYTRCRIYFEDHCVFLQVLKPLGHYATANVRTLYPEVTAGEFVQQELESICLKA